MRHIVLGILGEVHQMDRHNNHRKVVKQARFISHTNLYDNVRQKLSITINQELLQKLDSMLSDGTYRNKSHLVEMALRKFVEENHV
ncbi:hypothetical protein HY490_04865 [Candidatus Woesearchaeota archaeon]|nr:hypothetical protein [Candidatus Woesearchaeota archaeon]